jgi:DNA-binding MarR family transcriptional regulator/predicted GNAT family acetyltransferase
MDILKQLGELALGSRMRRLSERFVQDVSLLYKEQDIDFEPRWFPLYYMLHEHSPMSIVEIAKQLGVTHPAVNQMASEMIKAGMVEALKDENDKRKRLLILTPEARELYGKLKPIWDDIERAAHELTAATGYDVLAVLDRMERELDSRPFYNRIMAQTLQREHQCLEIVEYRPEYKTHFKTLNLAWIEKYFEVEHADERILANPEEEIIARGGKIFFAVYQGEIVGTCALIKTGDNTYELAKMAVDERVQGKQIGQKLLETSIQKAKEAQARTMTLETNTKLVKAINLYRKLGFVSIPLDAGKPADYQRVNLKMKLDLETAHA